VVRESSLVTVVMFCRTGVVSRRKRVASSAASAASPGQHTSGIVGARRPLPTASRFQNQMATASIEEKAVMAAANLLRSLGATQVFIFGSAARGELRPDSDVDLAVTGLPPQVYFSAVSKASDLLGRPVDLVDLDDPTPLVRCLLGSGELVRVA